MAIYFYSKNCEDCTGNHALASMKGWCKRRELDFQERRTILWTRWEEEANEIMEMNPGLKLPFFYNTDTGATLAGYSMTPLTELDKLIKGTKNE